MDHDISTKGVKPGDERMAKAPQSPFGSSPANSAGASGIRSGEEDVNQADGRVQQEGDPLTVNQKGAKP